MSLVGVHELYHISQNDPRKFEWLHFLVNAACAHADSIQASNSTDDTLFRYLAALKYLAELWNEQFTSEPPENATRLVRRRFEVPPYGPSDLETVPEWLQECPDNYKMFYCQDRTVIRVSTLYRRTFDTDATQTFLMPAYDRFLVSVEDLISDALLPTYDYGVIHVKSEYCSFVLCYDRPNSWSITESRKPGESVDTPRTEHEFTDSNDAVQKSRELVAVNRLKLAPSNVHFCGFGTVEPEGGFERAFFRPPREFLELGVADDISDGTDGWKVIKKKWTVILGVEEPSLDFNYPLA